MRAKRGEQGRSRRAFLKQMAWAPMLFLPAPLRGTLARSGLGGFSATRIPHFPFADVSFLPHYPEISPIDALLRFAQPGTDEYTAEGYAAQIMNLLAAWSNELRSDSRGISRLRDFVAPSIEFTPFSAQRETSVRSGGGIEVWRREFPAHAMSGRDGFLNEITKYFSELKSLETVDFEIYSCRVMGSAPPTMTAEVRYEIGGSRIDDSRESRAGSWRMQWIRGDSAAWQASQWSGVGEVVTRASRPVFVDITARVFG